MKLVVGLGNVGKECVNNRHNVGFLVVDKLVSWLRIVRYELNAKFRSLITRHQSLIFAKPQTMMNASGTAVKKLIDFYKIALDDLYVIYDDLDITLGEYKIQKGKGPKDHKGIISINKALGTSDYWHVRAGIESRKVPRVSQVPRVPRGEEFVLQNFTDDETEILNGVIDKIIKDLVNRLNS